MTTASDALALYESQTRGTPRPVFVWDARYDTGLAEVDSQHRRLVDIINHVDRLLRAQSPLAVLEPVLDELTAYAQYHFGTEERLMDSLRCEPAHVQRHKLAHEGFVKQVSVMRDQATVNPAEFIPTLLRFLSTWLVHHILTIDQVFARQVFAIRGGAPLGHAYQQAGGGTADTAAEALLDALNRLYDDVARRNLSLAELNAELKRREQELRTVQDELHEANRDLERRLADGEAQASAARAAFEAQTTRHASAVAGDGDAGRDVAEAIAFASRNLGTVRDCVADLFRVIEEYEKVRAPSTRDAASDARGRHDAEVLERLRRAMFEILEESTARLAQAGEVVERLGPRA